MFDRLLMLGINKPLGVLIFLFIVTLLSLGGLPQLEIDTSTDSLIPSSDPARLVYDRVSEEFGTDNRTIFYIRDQQLWTPEKLTALEKLHHSLDGLGFVTDVSDLFSLHTIRGENGKVDSRPLMSEAPTDQYTADRIRKDALDNPLIVDNFISRDATVTAIVVSIKEKRDDNEFNYRVNEKFESLIEPYRTTFEQIVQVGSPRINAELKASLFADFKLLGPLSAIVLVLSILFFLRSGFAAIIPIVTSVLSILWTFGMMGWVGVPLNILSAMLPSLIVAIGSTEDTHLITAYFHKLADSQNPSRETAAKIMLKRMGLPLILTVLTTALGFASNIFSSIELIQHFAIASTFALLANGVITILFVPIMVTRWGPLSNRVLTTQDTDEVHGIPGIVANIFDFSHQRFPRLILIVTLGLCLFFIYCASRLYVTNDPLSYFPESRPLIQNARQIHEDLSGIKIFFITLESEQEKAFQHPKNIQRLADIQTFMDKQNAFDRSISLADHLAFVNREFQQNNSKLDLPKSRELVSQYLLFFHRGDLDNYVSHNFSRANIVVRHNISDSHTLNQYIEELNTVVPAIAGPDMKASIVGENLMVNRAAESLLVAQVKSLVILLVVIFLIMSGMFTSFKGGIISLIPALIPIILMFGIMGLLDIPLNPGTAMVAVIAIGIAIDGTIHLFSRYNELCRRTSDYVQAVATTVREEATPLVVSSLALSLGFGILLFSNFTVVAQFGALAAATMLFSIFANLLITPLIMTHVRLVGLHQILSISVDQDVLENSPLFRGMSNYQRRKAILISETREFEEGDLLIQQDTSERSMYLLLSGEVEVVRRNENEDIHLAILRPGQVFGEIGFIKETMRTADVKAKTPVSVLRFDYEKLKKDLKLFPGIIAKLNFNISCILGERLADVVESMSKAPGK